MATPKTVYDMQKVVLEAIERLVKKEASVGETKAIIAGINSVQAGIALRQEQVRLTGKRPSGGALPDLSLDPDDQTVAPPAPVTPASLKRGGV